MATWRYEAKNSAGNGVTGTLVANDRPAALEILRGQGLFLTRLEIATKQKTPKQPPPLSVPESKARQTPLPPPALSSPAVAGPSDPQAPPFNAAPRNQSALPPLSHQPFLRASKRDVSTFFRQLSSAVHAGVSLGKSLSTLENHAPNAALRSASGQLQRRVTNGEPLSVGMRAFPGLFSPLMIGIVSAGESGGFLDRSFSRLADYSERDYELETSIKRETWYPKLIVFAAILIPGAVPLFLQGFGAFARQVVPPLLFLSALWATFKIARIIAPSLTALDPLFRIVDGIKLKLPIVGKITRGLATAKFCRALGALYAAGVSPSQSVKLGAEASGNQIMRDRCLAAIPRLEHGEGLTKCMTSLGVFHPIALQMMEVGEESGDLDTQLEKAADFMESDAETAIRQAIPVLGILAFLAVAAYVGSIVVAGFTSYGAQLNELMQ